MMVSSPISPVDLRLARLLDVLGLILSALFGQGVRAVARLQRWVSVLGQRVLSAMSGQSPALALHLTEGNTCGQVMLRPRSLRDVGRLSTRGPPIPVCPSLAYRHATLRPCPPGCSLISLPVETAFRPPLIGVVRD